MPISPDVLLTLKNPFGELVPDKNVNEKRVKSALKGSKLVIAVGDATTDRLVSFGIIPDIAVIDERERRQDTTRRVRYSPSKELQCANPPGTIVRQAITVLQPALADSHPTLVVVKGEEDLLALPMVSMAPLGSVVLYGQPLEGLVIIKITRTKQQEAKDLMEKIMDTTSHDSS
jgi:uncharacterized protein (UPF0218 family)